MGARDKFRGRGGYRGQPNMARVALLAGFCLISLIAIGIPLFMSKPKVKVEAPPPKVEPPVQLVEVFVPKQRINAGTPLTASMFQKESMSQATAASLGGKPVKSIGDLEGRVAKTIIQAGKVIMSDQIMDAPDYLLARKIQPGYRAITVQLDNVTGIEGWGVPGTRVDVLWYASDPAAGAVVTTIVKGVEVLSVQGRMNLAKQAAGQEGYVPLSSPNTEKSFTVTLLVSPADGQKLFLASRSGELSLMLNGEFDSLVDSAVPDPVTAKGLVDTLTNKEAAQKEVEKVEGVVKAKRPDGSSEEWSVIEGRVWRWDQGNASPWATE